jgi:uncharacterized membrane protein YebE (DUF533 family)
MNYMADLEDYIAAQLWLNETHFVEIGMLRGLAERLNDPKDFSPALVAQYGLWFRALKAQAPKGDEFVDEVEALLPKNV